MNMIHSTFSAGRIPPKSCDTFAVMPSRTLGKRVIFGKNSDRPSDEVQEVIYVPAADHPKSSKLKCTYIEIEQAEHTYAVILSKPAWMWGAEMGANEHDVCIGNEAVWTVLNGPEDEVEKLLGMDLLRLGLERAKSAVEAVKVIVAMLEQYGMGGNCSDTLAHFTYHNSFLVADPCEVWILECAGTIWAAEKVHEDVRNISNELSIGCNVHMRSFGCQEVAQQKGLWDPKRSCFNFKQAYDSDGGTESGRYKAGKRLLTDLSSAGTFSVTDMFEVLRDKPSGICMSPPDSFVSTGSQVSVLRNSASDMPSCHWFTATPDPSCSVFKPFVFTKDVAFPDAVISPSLPDKRHRLYKLHEEFLINNRKLQFKGSAAEMLEAKYVKLAKEIVSSDRHEKRRSKLFFDAVEEECFLYDGEKK